MTISTIGSGMFLNPQETDQVRINNFVRQLAEGRSNAVGTATLTSGGATSTLVQAFAIGATSGVWLSPTTPNAAAVVATTYVQSTDIASQQFYITHASTANADVSFFWVGFG
ncbi:MAG: hypothetical protein ACM3IH_14135 [Sphingobacteriales bacterium]